MTSRPPPSIADLTWPVRTPRLQLRPATPEDAAGVFGYRCLPEVVEWMTAAPADGAAFAEHFAGKERLAKTLVAEHDGRLVGDLMIAVEDAWSQLEVRDQAAGVQAEVGWCFDPEYHGQGLATEAAAALLEICFDGLGLRRVVANCFADNLASRRLMERLGMRLELHAVRESLHRSGAWLDGMGYAMLAAEWRSRERAPAPDHR